MRIRSEIAAKCFGLMNVINAAHAHLFSIINSCIRGLITLLCG